MPKLATKHANAEIVTFSDFSGGLNLSKPAEFIENNQMRVADNLEFSANTGMLKIRGGIVPVHTFPYPVTDIFPIAGADSMLVRSGHQMFRFSNGTVVMVGEVDGDLPGVYEFWGDNKDLLMVFGGHLHIYDGKTITRIQTEGAPKNANTVAYRNGRVMVTQTHSDTIKYSGVGDPMRWTEDTDMDAASVEVGYKDGCDMTAVAEMAGEVLVFKCPEDQPEYGRIYRLQGNVPDWTVIPYARGISAWNPNAVVNVNNSLLFITKEGLASLETVTEYGDFKQAWAGANINPMLWNRLTNRCRLWHIPPRSQVWLWDGNSSEVWVYHTQMGGAWTKFLFHGPVTAAAHINDETYVAIGDVLYKMSDSYARDQIEEAGFGDEMLGGNPGMIVASYDGEISGGDPYMTESMYSGVLSGDNPLSSGSISGGEAPDEEYMRSIIGKWRPKTLTRRNQILVKGVTAGYIASIDADATVKVEGFRMPLPMTAQGDIAILDTDISALDTDPLVPFQSSIMRRRCNIRKWEIMPEIEITNGSFNLSFVSLEMAEV
jgi:hypothetical protein